MVLCIGCRGSFKLELNKQLVGAETRSKCKCSIQLQLVQNWVQ